MTSRAIAAMFVFAVLECAAATASAESSKDILGTWTLHSLVVDYINQSIIPRMDQATKEAFAALTQTVERGFSAVAEDIAAARRSTIRIQA